MDHPALARTLSGLAQVMRRTKRKDKAKLMEARAQRILDESPKTNGLLVDLAELALR